jgi:hypothetical protein
MTKTMTGSVRPSGKASALIVYGQDQAGKPKAGRFAERHAIAAAKAAKALKLTVCEINKPAIAEVAAKIPVGRLHAQGHAFIPYIKREIFESLQAALTSSRPSRAAAVKRAGPVVTSAPVARLPRDWDSITEGDLVLYEEAPHEGWWEALVVARDGDTLTLKYRDYPKLPSFRCQFRSVALTHPGSAEA